VHQAKQKYRDRRAPMGFIALSVTIMSWTVGILRTRATLSLNRKDLRTSEEEPDLSGGFLVLLCLAYCVVQGRTI
jgi:hypothetical protein